MSFSRQFIGILVVSLGVAGWYVISRPNIPCEAPLTYRIGSFDAGFGISQKDFLKDIETASDIWNKAGGKKLFEYNPKGSLVINLIYDDRQKITQRNSVLKTDIAKIGQTAQEIKSEYESLERQRSDLENLFNTSSANFEKELSSYNADVKYWNDNGGAPPKEYNSLEVRRQELQRKQTDLEEKQLEINTLVTQINTFIKKYNLLAESANSNIRIVNETAEREFEEGHYDGNTNVINIYEFSSNEKLIRVLAHELGHAISLVHNENPESIMYSINQGSSLIPSKEDIEGLKTICSTN